MAVHYNTINSWIKEVNVLQRKLKDLEEVLQRHAPVAAGRLKVSVMGLKLAVDALLELDYEGKARGKNC